MSRAQQHDAYLRSEFRDNHGDAWGELGLLKLKHYLQVISPYPDDTACDFGGIDGYIANQWRRLTQGRMIVLDLLMEPLCKASNAVCADLCHLPLRNASIDWGFCSHTLEHVDDLNGALSELRRVIRRACLISVPLEDDEQVKKNQSHMRHSPDPMWWSDQVKRAGFNVTPLPIKGLTDFTMIAAGDLYD